MRSNKFLWVVLIVLILAVFFLMGMASVTRGYIEIVKKNPKQYYKLVPKDAVIMEEEHLSNSLFD